MERLWSSWRLAYLTRSQSEAACVFCEAQRLPLGSADADSLVLFRGASCYVILNLFPYNNGHLMVVPNAHVDSLEALPPEALVELIELTRRAEMALKEVYAPAGLNVGLNLGRPAGGSISEHLHMHVVPRWTGDTNFMSVVGETRVLPEELSATVARLRPVFARLARDASVSAPSRAD